MIVLSCKWLTNQVSGVDTRRAFSARFTGKSQLWPIKPGRASLVVRHSVVWSVGSTEQI